MTWPSLPLVVVLVVLVRVISGLGLASVGHHVVGHSMGGAVAALYTARHLPHVTSATFLAPAGRRHRQSCCCTSRRRRRVGG